MKPNTPNDSFNPKRTANMMRELARERCAAVALFLHSGSRPSLIDDLLTEVCALQVEASEVERW